MKRNSRAPEQGKIMLNAVTDDRPRTDVPGQLAADLVKGGTDIQLILRDTSESQHILRNLVFGAYGLRVPRNLALCIEDDHPDLDDFIDS